MKTKIFSIQNLYLEELQFGKILISKNNFDFENRFRIKFK